MKVEVAVLGSPSLTVLMVSMEVKQHLKKNWIRGSPARWGSHGVSWTVFCFRLFSTVDSVDTVCVTLFPGPQLLKEQVAELAHT